MQAKIIGALAATLTLALTGCYDRVAESNLRSVQTQAAGDFNLELLSKTGHVHPGSNRMVLEVHDAQRSDDILADVNAVQISAAQSDGTAASPATITATSPLTPGYFNVNGDFPAPGKWNMDVAFADKQHAQFTFDVK